MPVTAKLYNKKKDLDVCVTGVPAATTSHAKSSHPVLLPVSAGTGYSRELH